MLLTGRASTSIPIALRSITRIKDNNMDELIYENDNACDTDKPVNGSVGGCTVDMLHTPSKRDVKFMRAALAALELCPKDEVPVAAVVVCGDEIIGVGVNRRNTDNDPAAHAEIVAIREAAKKLGRWNLAECELYVTLEPCVMCAGAIVYSRIKRVVYGAKDLRFGACGTALNIADNPVLNHRAEIVGGVLEEQCLTPIQSFFKDKRKKNADKRGV